jgi:enoyl-CoA hydratase/carnithine racemase
VVPAADLLPAARAYAADLARNSSPRAMAVIAEQVRAAADSTYDEALERSYELMDRFVGSADMREGVASFVERRPARFAPLEPPD